MNIVYINSLYTPHIGGGAELVLKTQAEAMQKLGHTVNVVTIGPDAGVHEDNVDGLSVFRVGYRNWYFHFSSNAPPPLLRAAWHMRDRNNTRIAKDVDQLLDHLQPDIVCCHNLAGFSISLWELFARRNLPVLQVLHDQYLLCVKSTMFRSGDNCRKQCLDCALLRRGHARASSKVTGVVGVSRFILEKLTGQGYFSGVVLQEVAYNVSRDGLPPAVQRPADTGAELVLGFIGSLTETKGIALLLDTFVQHARPDMRLVVAGRGEEDYVAHLHKCYPDPRIQFIGYVPQDQFFDQIDVAVVPSLWNDTLPSVVFEALGRGIPAIGSNRGGIPEMLIDGKNGYVFEPARPSELANFLHHVNRAELLRMRDCCRASAAKFFDMPAWLRQHQSILQQCVSLHAQQHSRIIPSLLQEGSHNG